MFVRGIVWRVVLLKNRCSPGVVWHWVICGSKESYFALTMIIARRVLVSRTRVFASIMSIAW